MDHAEPEALPVVSASFNAPLLALLALAVAALAVVAAFFLRRQSVARGGTALLVLGPPDAGKTALLSILVYKQALPTQTSMQLNQSLLALPHRPTPLTVIDVPGHPRLRGQFSAHLPSARAIIFVVDASTISRTAPAVAEHLHAVLSALSALPPGRAPPLLVLAHKADLIKPAAGQSRGAAATARVRTVLERELERRRTAQSGAVGIDALPGADGEEGEGGALGGLECAGPGGGVFRFDEWEGGEVAFVGSWVKLWERLRVEGEEVDEKGGEQGGEGVRDVVEWIESVP